MKRKRSRNKRKKERKLAYFHDRLGNERKVKPTIGRLFKPLTATEEDTPEWIAVQLAERLQEVNTYTIKFY